MNQCCAREWEREFFNRIGPEAELRRPLERWCPRERSLFWQASQPCALHQVLEVVLAKAATLPPPAHSAHRGQFQQMSDSRPGFLHLSRMGQRTAEPQECRSIDRVLLGCLAQPCHRFWQLPP